MNSETSETPTSRTDVDVAANAPLPTPICDSFFGPKYNYGSAVLARKLESDLNALRAELEAARRFAREFRNLAASYSNIVEECGTSRANDKKFAALDTAYNDALAQEKGDG